MNYIIVEIPRADKDYRDRLVHEIPVSDSGSGYPEGISLSSFCNGDRKYVSKRDLEANRTTCNWGPNSLFTSVQREDGWLDEKRRDHSIMVKSLPDWPDITDQNIFPRIKHKNVWEFYKSIGFDRENRCYISADGTPIKYSTLS